MTVPNLTKGNELIERIKRLEEEINGLEQYISLPASLRNNNVEFGAKAMGGRYSSRYLSEFTYLSPDEITERLDTVILIPSLQGMKSLLSDLSAQFEAL